MKHAKLPMKIVKTETKTSQLHKNCDGTKKVKSGGIRKEATFRHIFKSISKLKDTKLSPPCMIRNLPWKIMVMQKKNQETNEKKSLGFFVQCNEESKSTAWSCNASASLKILSWNSDGKPLTRKFRHLFRKKANDRGYHNFLSWNRLLDPKQGYVKDDAIRLEVCVKADIPRGVSRVSKTQVATYNLNAGLQHLPSRNESRGTKTQPLTTAICQRKTVTQLYLPKRTGVKQELETEESEEKEENVDDNSTAELEPESSEEEEDNNDVSSEAELDSDSEERNYNKDDNSEAVSDSDKLSSHKTEKIITNRKNVPVRKAIRRKVMEQEELPVKKKKIISTPISKITSKKSQRHDNYEDIKKEDGTDKKIKFAVPTPPKDKRMELQKIQSDGDSASETESDTDSVLSTTSSMCMEIGKVKTHKFVKRKPTKERISHMMLMADASKSVGIIGCGGKSFGTGFMVGAACVMTALHVLKSMLGLDRCSDTTLRQQINLEMARRDTKISFNYLSEFPEASNLFYFKKQIKYINKKCDICILEIDDLTSTDSLPPSFQEFGDLEDEDLFELIGHPNGNPKERDISCRTKRVSEEEITTLSRELRSKYPDHCNAAKDPYFGIHNKNIYIFDCSFQHSASGSPGIRFNSHGEPVVCTILNGGFPLFYWNLNENEAQYCADKFRFEYGAKMSSVFNYMIKEDKDLAENIFRKYYFQDD